MLFKKGDPASCSNYRPVCLTSVAYRVYACMLKNRLLEAGLDASLWPSQYGFRKQRSTEDAIFCARRYIELTCARRNGKVSLLALDWAKAFDSVHIGRLMQCLERFGISGKTAKAISGLMQSRKFFVEEDGVRSSTKQQNSGISQGCTLSPLLFLVVMSAVMEDAIALLSPEAHSAYTRGELADIVYADDTMLIGSCPDHLEEFLKAVAAAGKNYGMALHEDKFQLLQIGAKPVIRNVNKKTIQSSSSLTYLGATLAEDGRVGSELARRVGAAKADFRALRQVWRGSSLSRQRKLKIYQSLIESKLMYCLSTACFSKAELRKLDGFQSKCLRSILGIAQSYISRISNADVRAQTQVKSLSVALQQRQLAYLGKILKTDKEAQLRTVRFIPGTLQSATSRYVRRIGRPRKEWVSSLLPIAFEEGGGFSAVRAAAMSTNNGTALT